MKKSKREFVYIAKTSINHEDSMTDVKTLKGTRKLHAIKNTNVPGQVKTKNLSCFCRDCIHAEYVEEWELQQVKQNRYAYPFLSIQGAWAVQRYPVPSTSTVPNTASPNTGAYSFQFLTVCLSVFCKSHQPKHALSLVLDIYR